MQTPQDSGMDTLSYGILAALGAVAIAFVKRLDPRMILVWANAPTMKPLHERLDRIEGKQDKIRRVIDAMPGADDAHAKIKAEDERW